MEDVPPTNREEGVRFVAADSENNNARASPCPPLPTCFHTDRPLSRRSRLMRRISGRLLGHSLELDVASKTDNEVDEPCVTDVMSYLQGNVSADTRTNIAKYLATHDLTQCKVTMEDVHHYYHVADFLKLRQLSEHCLKFCSQSNQYDVLAQFEGCSCYSEIKQQSKTGYQRSSSIVSNSDETSPPVYYIVFSDNIQNDTMEAKAKKHKHSVMVIDVSEKLNVCYREVEKLQQFGEGFACCACEIRESPYIFVAGGKGKSNQMWMYDVLLGRWSKCAKMIQGRSLHMMVSVGDKSVVVLGGQETSSIEEYDIKRNKWRDRGALLANVKSSVVTALQEKVYIFGGETLAGPVATCQCYDVTSKTIDRLPYLPCQFSGGQCVTFKDKIFIATDQGHMMCFDPGTECASLCTQQPVLRSKFGMFVKNDRIYLVGGLLDQRDAIGGKEQIPQYRYNPDKDTWVEKYKLCEHFPVLACCTITYPQKCCIVPFTEKF